MAMVGAIIASAVVEEDATSPVAETAVGALMQAIVDMGQAPGAVTCPTVAHPHAAPMPQ